VKPDRCADVRAFYEVLDKLCARTGELSNLESCTSSECPAQGVYFFFEPGEFRELSGQFRVTRVGTHAVSAGSTRTLWNRLSTHRGAIRGANPGGGNHRGSIFRLHVGKALLASGRFNESAVESWGIGSSAKADIRLKEAALERAVSAYVRDMPFVCISLPGTAGPSSDRAYVERNAIALLSNLGKSPIDPPSPNWLGRSSPTLAISGSGLWNIRHVNDEPEPEFVERFNEFVAMARS
jgi:hypothetical protein